MAKKGFSLLETLFSIVIIAIILSIIPTLLKTINSSAKSIVSKDILFQTVLETINMSVYRWDENSEDNYSYSSGDGFTVDSDKYYWFNRVLDTNSSNFKRQDSTVKRAYELKTPDINATRRFFRMDREYNSTRISATSSDSFSETTNINCFDDIDDWNGQQFYFSSGRIDFNISYKVFYIADTQNGFNSSNNSQVTITIKASEINTTSNLKYIIISGIENIAVNPQEFSLHYIASNIGEESTIWLKKLDGTDVFKADLYIPQRKPIQCNE